MEANIPDHYKFDSFSKVVSESKSFTEVTKALGISTSYANRHTIKKYINYYQIDISHFTYGLYKKKRFPKKRSLKDILVKDSTYNSTANLKKRLYKEGLKERKCEMPGCGQGEMWMGKKLSLHLDHINGDNKDNRIENLRILCPNCHATTSTYGGRNNKRDKSGSDFQKFKHDYHKKKTTCKCGSTKYKDSEQCVKCRDKSLRKIKDRPSKDQLLKEVKELGYVGTGRKYGVSDNTIRKWLKPKKV